MKNKQTRLTTKWFALKKPLGIGGFGIKKKIPKQIPFILIRLPQGVSDPETVAIHSAVKEQELAGPTSKFSWEMGTKGLDMRVEGS